MDRYNAEHYTDLTAAIAIDRTDRNRPMPIRKRGGYFIGDLYVFTWENGVLMVALQFPKMQKVFEKAECSE